MKTLLILTLLGLAAFAAHADALDFRGNDHEALGSALLTLTNGPAGKSLVVSNLGASGADGVAIRPADPNGAFEIRFGPIGASSFTIGYRAADETDGRSFVITSVKHSASEPVGYETGANPGDSYSASFYDGPLLLFASPAVGPGILAESVLNPETVVLAPGASGDAFSIEYILPAPEELFYVPSSQSFTGDRIVVERIENNPAAAGPPLSMDVIEVTATDLPEFTLLDETPGPRSLPALSLPGCAALVAFLLLCPPVRRSMCVASRTRGFVSK